MPISAAGSDVAPTLVASRTSLPLKGASLAAWGGPALRLSAIAHLKARAARALALFAVPVMWKRQGVAFNDQSQSISRLQQEGFTLLELLVVIAIIAVATAGVSLSMRDNAQTSLEREAQRLAVLFESARAQSRASGSAVIWRPTADGFKFEGILPGTLPTRWLEAGTRVDAKAAIQLGPDPVIGAQAVDIFLDDQGSSQPARVLRIATDGLRPFALQAAGLP